MAPAVPKKDEPVPDPKANVGKDDAYGFKVQDLSKDLAEKLKLKGSHGAVVTDVAENSPAAAAGVETDDLITGVDSAGGGGCGGVQGLDLTSMRQASRCCFLSIAKGRKPTRF